MHLSVRLDYLEDEDYNLDIFVYLTNIIPVPL